MNLINNLQEGSLFLGHPGQGTLQVEKAPHLSWAIQFLTVAYNGACSTNVISEWREFPSAPCLAEKKKLDDSSRLGFVEIAHVALHASFPPLQQEKIIRHMNRPLFPTELLIPSYDIRK